MAKRLQVYETPEITVTFDPNICIHSGACVRGLPSVFDVGRRDWIRPYAARASELAAQIQRCPSGALQYRWQPAQSSASEDPGQPPSSEER